MDSSQGINLTRRLTPTLVARACGCLHSWYLECYGDPEEKKEPDAGTLLTWERGKEHERSMVATLEEVVEPDWDEMHWAEGIEATIDLMKEGHPWIYQAVLSIHNLAGKPDLLRRVDGQSNLGNYTYIPIDAKNHKAVKRKDKFQLLAYALLMEPILGTRPSQGGIWLNTSEIKGVKLSPDLKEFHEFEELLGKMEEIQERKLETRGFRCEECKTCSWVDHCERGWRDDTHSTCLVRGVSATDAQKLIEAGIRSYEELLQRDNSYLSATLGKSEEKTRDILLHAKAWAEHKALLKAPVSFPREIPIYFYDIETYGDCTYLHGVIRMDGDQVEEQSFLAREPSSEQEEEQWHKFLDYLSRGQNALVYCWTYYEKGFIDKLWDTYGGNPAGWELLSENLEDQCAFVKKHFALPVTTYGIKEVAPVFGFHWHAEDAGGLNSEMWYKQWLETGKEDILKKIVEYNLDDVRAMKAIHLELVKLVESGVGEG